jgi:arsenite methyltransferase
LKSEVRATYSRAASHPGGDFHFHRGAEYAARRLGYDYMALQALAAIHDRLFRGRWQSIPNKALYFRRNCH